MKSLTTNPELNATLGNLFVHARLTSFGVPTPKTLNFENEDTAHDMNMRSHVSNCCGSIVHFDLEQPYCAGCGEWCQAVVYGSVE